MVKVRFAPSPTGNLHIGNALTAVINYLFSRKEKGRFCLRIEDTDVERSSKEYELSIIEDLKWLGIDWDEGPIRQTERLDIYRIHADILINKGFAYRCFCTKEEVEYMRQSYLLKGLPPRYNGRCRDLPRDTIEGYIKEGRGYVVRFKSFMKPLTFQDVIHGSINFPYDHVDDFIILRSDGIPSYNFAAAVDDMITGITHVIRGTDHISNTPKQIMLFQALEGVQPIYAHHSLLVGEDRKPLSKRHGVTSISDFRAMGIMREALINYLGIIGRSMEKEFMSQDELIDKFELHSLSCSDSFFDLEKLLWLNKEHIKRATAERLIEEAGLPKHYREKAEALKENIRTLRELKDFMSIFDGAYIDDNAMDFVSKIKDIGFISEILEDSIKKYPDIGFDDLYTILNERLKLSKKELMLALRVIITGKKSGPPIKDIFPLIDINNILKRLECLKKTLSLK
ncbi:MAG TPA: glutamate--tRNA ligase [Syntrophorhabdaceae bacterium]|nr:glutamate--tRNA ligase [Syntrophorhabdaceae bacterium]